MIITSEGYARIGLVCIVNQPEDTRISFVVQEPKVLKLRLITVRPHIARRWVLGWARIGWERYSGEDLC
jgi:hypothetical protein